MINEGNLFDMHKENWGKIGVFRNYSFCPHVHFHAKKNLFKRISLKKVTFSIAGAGFEPYDLRVMSPTSYQTALPRDISLSTEDAGHRVRTGTILSYHGILSPGRLPIPPLRHIFPLEGFPLLLLYYSTAIEGCQYLFEK